MRFVIGLSFLIMSVLVMGLMVYSHEDLHRQIFANYGINSEIKLFSLEYFPHAVTVAEQPCPTETCELSHAVNDAVGYHILPLYTMLTLGIYSLIILKENA